MAYREAAAAALAALGLASGHACAQKADATPSGDAETLGSIVVVGKRASLATAQEIKREKLEIVDSVVAEDINKLPDISVTDALQRITGVQVARDRGDGTSVAIRGLTQIETTLNGREVFTAGNGRNLEYADIPAEMLAGIDVYKTSAANLLEGGIGGLVNLRTRRPFDFVGGQAIASVRELRGDLVDQGKTQYSMLLSNRWKAAGFGEFGALLSVAVQDRAFREDLKSIGNPVVRSVGGQTVIAPNGTLEAASFGTRKRRGGDLALQWHPNSALDLYAEANYSELTTIQNQYYLQASAPATASAATTIRGTQDVQSITWTNASLTTAGVARDTIDRNSLVAFGGSWNRDDLTIKADFSYAKSHNFLHYSALALNGTVAELSQDLSSRIPATSVHGTDLASLASFTSAGMWYATRPFDGELKAGRVDGDYHLAGEVIDSVAAGLRVARRHATDAPGQVAFYPATVAAASAVPLLMVNPISDFLSGSTSIGGYLVGDPNLARNSEALRQALGIAGTIPADNLLGTWDITEDTHSAYVMATIRAAALPLDGNVGVRVVQTRESVSGYQTAPSGGTAPIADNSRYLDTLPSLNLRYQLAKGLYLRGAASKTITRPDFNQMSPSLTLNPIQLSGTAGNPDLRPVRSDNFDVALEWYFAKSSSAYLTVFNKKVDGFVITTSGLENHDGLTYTVSRPQNANTADVNGFEVGYQQFYDFLPGWLSGLGLQANYTYVDSKTKDNTLNQEVSLQNLSRNSYNLVLMYEKGPVSARLAYNWRDKFLTGVGNYSGIGPVATYVKAYGWLDASLIYRLNDKVSFSLEGLNLTRTVRQSYWGIESRPNSTWINDRQIGATATIRF